MCLSGGDREGSDNEGPAGHTHSLCHSQIRVCVQEKGVCVCDAWVGAVNACAHACVSVCAPFVVWVWVYTCTSARQEGM